jgi:hypothetical protein
MYSPVYTYVIFVKLIFIKSIKSQYGDLKNAKSKVKLSLCLTKHHAMKT